VNRVSQSSLVDYARTLREHVAAKEIIRRMQVRILSNGCTTAKALYDNGDIERAKDAALAMVIRHANLDDFFGETLAVINEDLETGGDSNARADGGNSRRT
jgi:hypothetical protein